MPTKPGVLGDTGVYRGLRVASLLTVRLRACALMLWASGRYE